MSGRAMHTVLVNRPEDDKLTLLLLVIADHADDAGAGASVGWRQLAERVRCGASVVRRLLQEAINEGWLVVDKPGHAHRRAVYRLGPSLHGRSGWWSDDRSTSLHNRSAALHAEYENRAPSLHREHSSGAGTSDVVGRNTTAARPPAGAAAGWSASARVPPLAGHPPDCRCDGTGWVDHTGGGAVVRCPGLDAPADEGRSRRRGRKVKR